LFGGGELMGATLKRGADRRKGTDRRATNPGTVDPQQPLPVETKDETMTTAVMQPCTTSNTAPVITPQSTAAITASGGNAASAIAGTIPAGSSVVMMWATSTSGPWTAIRDTPIAAPATVSAVVAGAPAGTAIVVRTILTDTATHTESRAPAADTTFTTLAGAGDPSCPPAVMSKQRTVDLMGGSARFSDGTFAGYNGNPALGFTNSSSGGGGSETQLGAKLRHLGTSYTCQDARLPPLMINWAVYGRKNRADTTDYNQAVEIVWRPLWGRIKAGQPGAGSHVQLTNPSNTTPFVAGSIGQDGTSGDYRTAIPTKCGAKMFVPTNGDVRHPNASQAGPLVNGNPAYADVAGLVGNVAGESRFDDVSGAFWARLVPLNESLPMGSVTANPVLIQSSADAYPTTNYTAGCDAGVASTGNKELTATWQQFSWHTSTDATQVSVFSGTAGVSDASYSANPPPGYA
jgi:hypothetical protein